MPDELRHGMWRSSWRLWSTGFCTAPLRFEPTLGLLMPEAPVLYGIAAIAVKLAGFSVVPGYASLLATITLLSGVQLMVIGMVGQS